MEPVWNWGILGLLLLAVELATGTLYILWFGIAALIVALLLWLIPDLMLPLQLFLFAVLSIGTLVVWKKYEKRLPPLSRLGQSQGEEIGREGVITTPVAPQRNGRIQFTQGLMGSREWAAISSEELAVGDHAIVQKVEGNALRVIKKPS